MLEGEAGLRNRIDAWEMHSGNEISSDFRATVQAFEMGNEQDLADLGALLPKGGVVIIDTLNRAVPGLDENSGKDMGLILSGMKRLQEVTQGLVLVVHPTGKDAARGLRGHSSLPAARDGAIEVVRKDNVRSWNAAKVKDGLDGVTEPFKLHVLPPRRGASDQAHLAFHAYMLMPGFSLPPPRGDVETLADLDRHLPRPRKAGCARHPAVHGPGKSPPQRRRASPAWEPDERQNPSLPAERHHWLPAEPNARSECVLETLGQQASGEPLH